MSDAIASGLALGELEPVDLEKRAQTDGYHHYLGLQVISPKFVSEYMSASVEDRLRMTITQEPLTCSGEEALRWLKKRVEEDGLDARDLSALEQEGNIFWMINRFLLEMVRTTASFLPPDKIQELLSTGRMTSTLMWHALGAYSNGGRIMQICKGLAEKLFLTDIDALTCGDLRLPFPTTVLHVPPYMISLEAVGTGWHGMDTVYVSEGSAKGIRVVALYFVGRENKNSRYSGDDASYYFNMTMPEDSKPIMSVAKNVLERGSAHVQKGASRLMRGQGGQMGGEMVLRAIRFVTNLLVYINTTGDYERAPLPQRWHKLREKERTLTGRKKRNAQRKRLEIERVHRPYLVGAKISIDPNLSKIAKAHGQGNSQSPSVASYVRGHWRQQAHGPGRTLRKPLWIEPHWRNLKAEKGPERKYDVK